LANTQAFQAPLPGEAFAPCQEAFPPPAAMPDLGATAFAGAAPSSALALAPRPAVGTEPCRALPSALGLFASPAAPAFVFSFDVTAARFVPVAGAARLGAGELAGVPVASGATGRPDSVASTSVALAEVSHAPSCRLRFAFALAETAALRFKPDADATSLALVAIGRMCVGRFAPTFAVSLSALAFATASAAGGCFSATTSGTSF